jgi:CheY-like chemotaxis protein/HPt (histidine-containing phosphotransfer) domain-containing protein
MDRTRLLLVEDDAVSAAFLAEALADLPATVDVAGSIAEALRHAQAARHALWLVDAHLPDGDGLQCLRALRAQAAATPALAITAGNSRAELDALCAGGFPEVLMKPVAVALLLATVRRLLALPDAGGMRAETGGKVPGWDEQRALAAIGGNPQSLARLRRLFLDELPGMRAQLAAAQAGGDAVAVSALLHKLRASCGFVGAARIARAVEQLASAPLDAAALQGFEFAADDALDALAAGDAQR